MEDMPFAGEPKLHTHRLWTTRTSGFTLECPHCHKTSEVSLVASASEETQGTAADTTVPSATETGRVFVTRRSQISD